MLFLTFLLISLFFIFTVPKEVLFRDKYQLNDFGLTALVAALVIGTGVQVQAQTQAAKAQRSANELQRRRQAAADARERQLATQRARRAQAEQRQAAINQGIAGSSVEAGAVGSTVTQLSSALGAQSTQSQLSNLQTQALGKVADAQERGALGQAITGIARTAAPFV